mmetsp:Transcript_5495/g.12818  ORF Transcript_5495/g.12818 Transcript_5495/m.12818 type:complete len:273 (+) Transcript_5495:598-1416(+)
MSSGLLFVGERRCLFPNPPQHSHPAAREITLLLLLSGWRVQRGGREEREEEGKVAAEDGGGQPRGKDAVRRLGGALRRLSVPLRGPKGRGKEVQPFRADGGVGVAEQHGEEAREDSREAALDLRAFGDHLGDPAPRVQCGAAHRRACFVLERGAQRREHELEPLRVSERRVHPVEELRERDPAPERLCAHRWRLVHERRLDDLQERVDVPVLDELSAEDAREEAPGFDRSLDRRLLVLAPLPALLHHQLHALQAPALCHQVLHRLRGKVVAR